MATECIVPVDDPPLKTKRKSHKVKLRAGVDGTTHLASQKNTASSMEALETNGPEGSIVRKGSKRTRKSSTLNAVEPNEHNVLVAVGEETSQAPTISECHVALAGPPETQPRSQLGSAQHRNVDSSDKEISQVSVPTSSAGHSKASLNTQVTAPKCTEISEVALEVYSEGNSDQSSDEGETEENRLYRVTGSVNASAASVLPLEDRLAALIHGTVKRGPRASILNEIPSSSETGSESSAEDLILDEEEDLWRQPPHKQIIALLTTRPSSTEPERTSEDEDNASAPVDMSHEVSDRPQKLPPIGGTGDHASNNLEREATERPAHDTNPVKPCEIQKRISSISPPSAPNKVDDTVPSSHFTKIPGAEYPVSIVAPINTEPAKTPILASDKGKTGRVLVSASSPVIDGAAAKTRSQLQHANDDVESIVGSHDGNEESDPIEPEPTQPSANLSQSIDPNPHHPRKCGPHNASKPPPVSQQPSRRSGRLANRLSHMETPEATLIPLTQVRHKIPSSFEDPRLWMHDDEGAAREQGLRKQGGKPGINFPRAITQHASDSGDETSPSVAREDGSPRVLISSQVKWTTLLLSEQTQPDASSIIDELRTSSQGSSAKLAPRGDEPSPSSGKNKTPVPTRRRIGRGGKGKGIAQPLFFPGSSQLPPVPSPSGTGSENESQTAASVLAKKTPSSRKANIQK
ncbi:hypothetical protein F5148DRAFT_308436 [Russula earlei]|uniref:Uncharacterized protein n=1 Tax=Russula earlei TaxID=71964 RepID=A0ACC0U421_9AGAM|nr:hypothetical protein F5148DRAFT_308436 [Russula earlei]